MILVYTSRNILTHNQWKQQRPNKWMQQQREETVNMLLRGGADARATDAAGRTPLLLAEAAGNTSVVKALLAASTSTVQANRIAAAQQALRGEKGG
jgi:ankyrin repeat protein